jgi:aminoglycoside 6'-N-acetyltransferase
VTAAGEPTFRPLERRDLGLLGEWLAAPHVEPWWREDPSPAAVDERYGPSIDGTDRTEVFVVELDGEPLGLVQRYRFADEPEWWATLRPTLPAGTDPDRVAGLDYLIGRPERLGRGLGPQMLDAFSADTFGRYPECDTIAVAVHADNRRSWRALEKIGYRRVYEGALESDDPADEGIQVVYVRDRRDRRDRGEGGDRAAPPTS